MTKKDSKMNPVFGPVPSRRLGLSLGVDVCPMKVCSYDCIYCEVGPTTHKTCDRRAYVPLETISSALEDYFLKGDTAKPDYVTFAGSGEPTLNIHLGSVIRKIKELTDTPVAVLTNGSLLHDKEVRKELMAADLVMPSLDAATEEVFQRINRPAPGLTVSKLVDGLKAFIQESTAQVQLEILLVQGINDDPAHVEKLVEYVAQIQPGSVQLTTAYRPSRSGVVQPVDRPRLDQIASMMPVPVDVVAEFNRRESKAYNPDREGEIATMLKIRPVTLEDLSASMGLHPGETLKYLETISQIHTVEEVEFQGKTYYQLPRNNQ